MRKTRLRKIYNIYSAKSIKIELSEEFMAMWRDEQTLWDVMSPLYGDKNEKQKFEKNAR